MDFAEFVLCKELEGHGGPVNALLFSDDGKLLVSGGDDGRVHVWDTATLKRLQSFGDERWGQTTALTWVVQSPRATARHNPWLCIGSERGLATICPLVSDHSLQPVFPLASERSVTFSVFGPTEAVAAVVYDCINCRLVFASSSGNLSMYTFDNGSLGRTFAAMRRSWMLPAASTFQESWYKNIGSAVPVALFFFGNEHQSLLALRSETAELICYEAQDCETLWSKALSGGVGSAAVSAGGQFLVVHNTATGLFDLYEVPFDTPLRSFQPTFTPQLTAQCAFLADCKIVVLGGMKNGLEIMDITSGECVKVVKTAKDDVLHTAAMSSVQPDRYLIAGGSASTLTIYIWKKHSGAHGLDDFEPSDMSDTTVAGLILILALLLTYPNWSPYAFHLFDTIIASSFALLKSFI